MGAYDDASARARGLATHLVSTAEWQRLADAADLPTLAGRLEQGREPLHLHGYATSAGVERAVRQRAGERLALLGRWCEGHRELLEVIFGDEDRRSLRAIVRGAAAAAPAEDRLRGTLPTPALPLRALETLAAQSSIPAVAALLVVWRHPAASALEGVPRRGPPDLLLLETALSREFAGRALAAARHKDAPLRWHIQTLVDCENVLTALALSEATAELELSALFIAGGSVPLATLERVARARPRLAGLEVARAVFRGTVLQNAFKEVEPSRLNEHLAALRRAHIHHLARVDPLGSAPVLDYALKLREETQRFHRLGWALSLGAPLEERLGEAYLS